jgi:CrcB protein
VLGVVAVGGAVGALLRYGLTLAFPDAQDGFPWTIFAVNVVGCFVLALLPAFTVVRRRPLLPPLLGTGVLGGSGRVVAAALYVVGTLAACLAAVLVADRFSSASARREFDAEEGDL